MIFNTTVHRSRFWVRLFIIWALFLFLLSMHWWRLEHRQQIELAKEEEYAELRALQASHALSTQVAQQFLTIDFTIEHLAEHWHDHDYRVFSRLIEMAQQGIFSGSLASLAITDTVGNVVFVQVDGEEKSQEYIGTSLLERDYFKQVKASPDNKMLIGKPVFNSFKGEWTVQFIRPILKEQEFIGTIIASVSVEHLAQAFRRVYPNKNDVVLLAHQDGHYITRSHGLQESMGKKLPAGREFFQNPLLSQGKYQVVAPVDGVRRFYVWHRIDNYPVILSLGLERDKIIAPLLQSFISQKIRNAIVIFIIIIAALWISRLAFTRSRQSRHLADIQERLTTLLQYFPSGLILENQRNHILTINQSACSLLGITKAPELLYGSLHEDLLTHVPSNLRSCLEQPNQSIPHRQTIEADDDSMRSLEITWIPITRNKRKLGHIWMIEDISSRKKREKELITLANTDGLTGMPNRRNFMQKLGNALQETEHKQALLLLDIDYFKRINDEYGHQIGDLVLQHIAQLIQKSLKQDEHSGRLGGEEFGIILRLAPDELPITRAEQLRQKIAKNMAKTASGNILVTASIGVCLLKNTSLEAAYQQADRALYHAKKAGRNQTVCCQQL